MSSPSRFEISERHYDIITKQAADNFPKEAGGFLGGKDFTIQAILPIFNGHIGNQTDTFSFIGEDIERAHLFFKKHGLTYYGLYHTHPSGIPYPSKTDIDTGHRFHFIIGVPNNNQASTVFRAYEIINRKPIAIPIQIIPNSKIQVVDIHGKGATETIPLFDRPITFEEEAGQLSEQINNLVDGKPKYERKKPKAPFGSDFSTLA
jgi:proteasome lid subunit RPN8/RPN11